VVEGEYKVIAEKDNRDELPAPNGEAAEERKG
jgi:hypothetical protein